MSNYSYSLIHSNATLQNEDTFVVSRLFLSERVDQIDILTNILLHVTKDRNKFNC